uniref:vesicle-fusing ATPase n=1 Tax=Acrobeloides nanus TaxID=290746 RepID=A0A914C8U7_9BILA
IMANETSLAKAIEIITRATEADRAKNYEEALRYYTIGVDYFIHALKHEALDEKQKDTIRNHVEETLARADKIKGYLATAKDKKKPVKDTKGIDIITKATEADRAKNYEEALRYYSQGVDCFIHALKHEAQGEKQKDTIRSRVKEFLARADMIQGYLATAKDKKPVKDGGNGKDDEDVQTKVDKDVQTILQIMANETSLAKGIEIITKATEADKAKNYDEALRYYTIGVNHFIHALKNEAQGEKQKDTIRNCVKEYLARADKIKGYLATAKDKKKSVKDSGNEKDDDSDEDVQTNMTEDVKTKVDKDMQTILQIMANENSLSKAIAIITKAIEADKAKNYEEALRYYTIGVDYFIHALKYEALGEKQNKTIRNRVEEYLARAEKIKGYLVTAKDKKKPVKDSGNGKDNKDDDSDDDVQ